MPAPLAHPTPAAAWLATAIVLSLFLRLPFLHVPLITDEGGYAYVAQRGLDGHGELYRDLWFDRPQGIFLVYGLIFHTLGTDVAAIRLGVWLASALTLIVVWGFARDIRDTRAAWPQFSLPSSQAPRPSRASPQMRRYLWPYRLLGRPGSCSARARMLGADGRCLPLDS